MKRWPVVGGLWVLCVPLTAGAGELLVEDFDGPTTVMDEFLGPSASSITDEASFSGDRALRMDNSDPGLFSARWPLGVSLDDAYARYMFRIDDAESSCWDSSQHYKNMGFEGGTNDCKGGDYTSDGTDCFTVRTRFNYPHLGVRVESPPYPGLFDTLVEEVDVGDGEWHCLEVDVHLNDPGQANGVIDVRVDGEAAAATELEFRTVPTLQIDKWWFTYWANDEWCGALYLDDLVVSDEPVGCPGAPPPDATSGGEETGAPSSGTGDDPPDGPVTSGGDPPPDDDAEPPNGDGESGDGDAPADDGVAPPPAEELDDEASVGCGCTAPRGGPPLGLLLLLAVKRRRRR